MFVFFEHIYLRSGCRESCGAKRKQYFNLVVIIDAQIWYTQNRRLRFYDKYMLFSVETALCRKSLLDLDSLLVFLESGSTAHRI